MPPLPSVRSARSLVAGLAVSVAAHGGALWLTLGGAGLSKAPRDLSRLPVPQISAATAGDTFDVPIEEPSDLPSEGRAPSEPSQTESTGGASTASQAAPVAASEGTSRRRSSARPAIAGNGSPKGDPDHELGGAGRFGAIGDRSAVELTTAFTHAFPQAASADPLWLRAPFGAAGTVDVDLVLDDTGALVDARSSGAPSPALAEGIRRTLALIRARSFIADGKETRLRVTATVTQDEVHDGLHGEVFAIGGSFEGGEGAGFFALAVGRRIDIRVRVVR